MVTIPVQTQSAVIVISWRLSPPPSANKWIVKVVIGFKLGILRTLPRKKSLTLI